MPFQQPLSPMPGALSYPLSTPPNSSLQWIGVKTAQQLIEDEVKEQRRELMRDVTKRSELRALGYDSDEIDAEIQEEKDEVECEVAEYRAELMKELPEREAELVEERDYTFALAAFNNVWLPQCLTPLDGESSTLVTKEVYESYLAWCRAVGISDTYSLAKVRSALKDYYGIEDIRNGLRAYRLVEVPMKINHDQIVARYEADERKREREAEKLRDLTCPYCQRRKYDGNRFDRCYWCHRILKDGFQVALSEYLSEGVDWERTGSSMRDAYQRMVDAGEITPPATSPMSQEEPNRAAPVYSVTPPPPPINQQWSNKKRKGKGLWATFKRIVKGAEKLGHWGGAKVCHQGLLASINVRANCSGRMSPIQLCSRQRGRIRTVSVVTYASPEAWEAAFSLLRLRR